MRTARGVVAVIVGSLMTASVVFAQAPGTPYDLKTAIETAVRNHPSVTVAGARVKAATTKTAAVGAQYRPFVELNASFGGTIAGEKNFTFREDTAQQGFNASPFYAGAVRFVMPIVREATSPFLVFPSERVAQAGQAGAEYAVRLARVESVGNATMAYYSMLAVREYLAASRQIVDLSQSLLGSVQRRFQQQLVPQVDVLAAESALVTARGELGIAESNVAKARELFALALGIDPGSERARTLDVVKTEEPRRPLAMLDELLKQMNAGHPSVLIQQAKVQEAEATRDLLRSGRWPTLDAVLAGGGIDDLHSSSNDSASLRGILRLNWNVFDFGVLSLRIKQQDETITAERGGLEQVRNQLGQSLVTAYRNFESSRLRLASAEKAVELAVEESRVASQREQQGLAPSEDTFKARVREASARRELAQASYASLIEEAAIAMAAGIE